MDEAKAKNCHTIMIERSKRYKKSPFFFSKKPVNACIVNRFRLCGNLYSIGVLLLKNAEPVRTFSRSIDLSVYGNIPEALKVKFILIMLQDIIKKYENCNFYDEMFYYIAPIEF
jgi:hypothetical protein